MQTRTLGLLALLGAVGVILLTLAVVLASGSLRNLINLDPNNSGGIIPQATASATALPTATPQPSPTPVVNWLRLSQTQVTFGCKKSDHSVSVVLRNLGNDSTGWNIQVQKPWYSGQLSVRPSSGEIGPDNSKTITLTYSPGFVAVDGSVTFVPTNDNAGDSPTLSFSAPPCVGTGSNSTGALDAQQQTQVAATQVKGSKHSGHGHKRRS